MSSKNSDKILTIIDEEEIFKSLGHKVRRDIIKLTGNQNQLSFTDIKNQLIGIDSPTLSYHLKSLIPLVYSKNNKYRLSEIGKAAYNLLLKTDQSHMVSKYKKRFIYAYIATVTCWVVVQTLIPIFLNLMVPDYVILPLFFAITLTLNIVAVVNYVLIWLLKKI
jgi:DNA-binding transcriptional ArsR family regulator